MNVQGDCELDIQQQLAAKKLDPLSSVNGLPTESFRDNLRLDTKYITSWGSGGWSNDVMSVMNLVYLGLITDRVPVLPVFLPSYFMRNNYGNDHSPLPFSQVFDLEGLRKAMKQPVLEWGDVKASKSTVLDEIGCWNVWESIQYHDAAPRQSFAPWFLKLDISYTKTPDWIKMKPNFEHDRYSSFWALASLAFPSTRAKSLVPPLPTKHNSDEMELDYSPAWRFVGRHMRWATRLERLADEYIRRTLHIQPDEPIPPFISVHVRHNDFKDWCEPGVSLDEFREVQDEIKERKGIEVQHVIVTSDEKNHTWWRDVDELGWLAVDHTRTKELHGLWVLDSWSTARST
ncbi:GDP-fucose protein O-fucosyltransferase-domain-containing protein, partial [Mycena olivaceomarginata]